MTTDAKNLPPVINAPIISDDFSRAITNILTEAQIIQQELKSDLEELQQAIEEELAILSTSAPKPN